MKNYTKELEDLFIGFMIKDGELYVRCQNIINSEFFSGKNRDIVDMIIEYSDKYKVLPTVEQIKATHGVNVDLENVDVARHSEWFLDEFQEFSKYMNLRVLGVYGGTKINTQKKACALGVDVVVATPGRLYDLAACRALQLKTIKQLVVDEVDVMLDLGFRI